MVRVVSVDRSGRFASLHSTPLEDWMFEPSEDWEYIEEKELEPKKVTVGKSVETKKGIRK